VFGLSCLGTVALGLGLQGAPARANAPAAEEELRTTNDALVKAVLKQDRPALERLLANELLYVHGDGQLRGKRPFIDELGKHLTYKGIDLSDQKVRVEGGLGILTARGKFHVFEHGHDAEKTAYVTRIFAKKQGRWELVQHQATPLPTPAAKK
jgi:hypothetical protein